MLKNRGIASEIVDVLSPDDFIYPPFRTIVKAIEDSLEKFGEVLPERFISHEKDQDVLGLLSELSLKDMEYEDIRKAMEDCLLHIKPP